MGILLSQVDGVDPAAAGNAAGSLVTMVVVYGLFFAAIWFFLFRPQSKEKKRTAAMLASLTIGDCVLTTSGFYGIVIDISEEDSTVIVEFGNNRNCRIPMEKSAISRVEKPEGN